MFALRRSGALRAVEPEFAWPDPKVPMKRATKSFFGLIADVGGDPTDRIACHRQSPPS
jgi:hypothetical protein